MHLDSEYTCWSLFSAVWHTESLFEGSFSTFGDCFAREGTEGWNTHDASESIYKMASSGCSQELGLIQFQSISIPSSSATSAVSLYVTVCKMLIMTLLFLNGLVCLLESALSPTFYLHGNIHSGFSSSICVVRKRVC